MGICLALILLGFQKLYRSRNGFYRFRFLTSEYDAMPKTKAWTGIFFQLQKKLSTLTWFPVIEHDSEKYTLLIMSYFFCFILII